MSEQADAPLKAPPKKMRLEEVAVRLGCGWQTVNRRVAQGYLHPVKRNGKLEFDADEVEWLFENPPSE